MIRSEVETTINIYGDEDVARIYTNDSIYIRRLNKICASSPETCAETRREGEGHFYTVPKDRIGFISKRKVKKTPERKAKREECMTNARAALAAQKAAQQ